jgi:hypothetical protein
MPGDSVYKNHTFSKETAHTSHETARYIAQIFTVQYKYMNFHSTIKYICISTIQVHEHYTTQQKTEYTEENKMNILPGNEPGLIST